MWRASFSWTRALKHAWPRCARRVTVPSAGRRGGRIRHQACALHMEALETRQMLAGDLVISELLASNDNDVRDEDRNRTDWIEICNTGTDAVDLGGWFLTDDAQDLDKWRFPDVRLEAGRRAVVFASGKDRAVPGAELHTNFQLSAAGEYLALVEPDGATVAFQYAPAYPPQLPDVSFGLPQEFQALTLHAVGDAGRLFIPASDELGLSWTAADFDDGAWTGGATGIGYSFRSEFDAMIRTNVKTEMKGVNPSIYLRVPFYVEDLASLASLTLDIHYNDGYVAFLNGVEVARANAPGNLAWDSRATVRRTPDESLVPDAINLTPFLNFLKTGDNVLAIQGLNDSASKSRFVISPTLTALVAGALQPDEWRYFVAPTAGGANGLGSTTAIVNVVHTPLVPGDNDDLTVTATVSSTVGNVAPVLLYYRVMFNGETAVPMFDDGLHGDGQAGDRVYGATIPAGIAAPGEMIRYRITAGDAAENWARAPIFTHPLDTAEYFGTVVADPSIQSDLPVLHLFVEDVAASETSVGTHGALFHNGVFYDNIEIDASGSAIGRDGPKKSHDIFATSDHWFEFQVGGESWRMNDFDIQADYYNPSKLRVPLAFETWRNIGTPAHMSFPVRVERNGAFYATYTFIDGGNQKYLEHAGLDPRGALYKFYKGFSATGDVKKQNREYEDNADLEALFAGVLDLAGEDRIAFLMDNVNIPATVNFLAGLVMTAHGDCCSKNLYLYRDTEGSGEWEPLPQDLDGTFGRASTTDIYPYYPYAVGVHPSGHDNVLFNALLDYVPGFRDMYLRRLRTVLDEFMQPPGTPADELKFEQRIDAMVAQLAADAALDVEKWGNSRTPAPGEVSAWEEQVAILRNEYFARRRVYLYGVDGDMDFSGTVDIHDVDDFVLGLADPAAYEALYGVGPSLRGDTNFDIALDFDDIGAFVNLVNGGAHHSRLVPAAQVGAPAIEFGEIDFDPISGNQDEEYIELTNPNTVAVDISGWQFIGGVDHTFASGVVIPAGGTLYVSPNVNAFRARQTGPSGGQSLFVQGNYSGRISNLGETIELVATDGTVVATVTTPAEPSLAQTYLRIREIMYHPQDAAVGSPFEDDDFEFIELVNTSAAATINLQNVAFTDGIEFTFPEISLGPGENALVVRDRAAFVDRYGMGPLVVGQYGRTPADSKLSNGGERLRLVDTDGLVIHDFSYRDNWYSSTDGGGYSLEMVDPLAVDLDLWGQKDGWLASGEIGGTPGLGRPRAALAVASGDVGCESAVGAKGGLLRTPARLSVPNAARDLRLARAEEDNTRANEGRIVDGAVALSGRR